jgi:hypothetical protein
LDGRDDKGIARIEIYSPEIASALYDPHNSKHMLACKIEYMYPEAGDVFEIDRVMKSGSPAGKISANSNYFSRSSDRWTEKLHMYTMIVTEEAYYTFRDHKLFGYDGNPGSGSPLTDWANPLGVVPMVYTPFIDVAEDMGLSTFDSAIDTLDSMNDLASMLGDIVANHADPILLMYGVNPQAIINKGVTQDGTRVWYIPQAPSYGMLSNPSPPKAEFLEMQAGNVNEFLALVTSIKDDLHQSIAELQLKAGASQSGESGYDTALRLLLLVRKMSTIRMGDFAGTERAVQVALVMQDIGRKKQSDGYKLLETAKEKYDLIVRADSPLPKDIAADAARQATDLGNMVMSKREVLLERGKTNTEIDTIFKQIDDEAAAAVKQQADHQTILADAQLQQQTGQLDIQIGAITKAHAAVKGAGGTPAEQQMMMMGIMNKLFPSAATQPAQAGPKPVPRPKGGTPGTKQTGAGSIPPSSSKAVSQPNRQRVGARQRRPNPGRKS